MTKQFLIMLVSVAALCAESTAVPSEKDEIRNLLKLNDFSAAVTRAKALNRKTPDDVSTYQMLAGAQLGMGDYDDAEKSIQWMLDLRLGKADAAGWFLVAQLREHIGDIDGAIDAANIAFPRVLSGQQPDKLSLLLYSVHLQMLAGKLNNAETLLKDMPMELPDGEAAHGALARLRYLQNRKEEATRILTNLVEKGSHPRYQYQLAILTENPADFKAFEIAAVKHKSGVDNANRELVLYYSGPGSRQQEALTIARSEAGKRHDNLTMDSLAFALHQCGETEKARSVMSKILEIGSVDPDVLRHAAALGLSPKAR